jgi:hypothetical protein
LDLFVLGKMGVAYPFTGLLALIIEPPRASFFALPLQFFFFQW